MLILWELNEVDNTWKNLENITCPATAKPSARREDVIQTCRHIWNAAMGVEPSLAANDAANVTQNVTAITLPSSSKPTANLNH